MKRAAAGFNRISANLLTDLRSRYGEPQRHYHTWAHIEALLGWFDLRSVHLHDPDAVFLAILFHDAVYDPVRKDNEAASAQLLRGTALPGWSESAILAAERMIMATAHHVPAHDLSAGELGDTAELLDMDLSILGASHTAFRAYDAAIRKEYRQVPWLIYGLARRRVLKAFLDRPRLYFSEWGQRTFEQAARINLTRRLRIL